MYFTYSDSVGQGTFRSLRQPRRICTMSPVFYKAGSRTYALSN
jgi:hypothetical protein